MRSQPAAAIRPTPGDQPEIALDNGKEHREHNRNNLTEPLLSGKRLLAQVVGPFEIRLSAPLWTFDRLKKGYAHDRREKKKAGSFSRYHFSLRQIFRMSMNL